VDGYSSCGKSTLSKALARKLQIRYYDSGAMYRAVTHYFLENNVPMPADGPAGKNTFRYIDVLDNIELSYVESGTAYLPELSLNGRNVEKEIRSRHVSDNVSKVSAIPDVRDKLVRFQRSLRAGGSLVMDGRDIGTTVFPDADLKLFMTADPKVRAKRRHDELVKKGVSVTYDEVVANLTERDREDSRRAVSPLRKADDAIVLDNTLLSEADQVEFALLEFRKLKKENIQS